jgi:valyl-tRNA synthetase
MHPWMPFITEEIWHLIKERDAKDCIIVAEWPKPVSSIDTKQLAEFEVSKEVVVNIRNIRAKYKLSPKNQLTLYVDSSSGHNKKDLFDSIIKKIANLNGIYHELDKKITENLSSSTPFMINTSKYYVPRIISSSMVEEEKQKLIEELEYNKGFLQSVQKKLANEKFVANAKPEVIAVERKKESDALSKIKAIEEQLSVLN